MSIKCPFYINQDIDKTFALFNFKCNEFDTYDNMKGFIKPKIF